MSETLAEITRKVAIVSDTYAQRCNITRDDDWYLLELQEELGELTAEAQRLTGRGRSKDLSTEEIRTRLQHETSDLLGHFLLFARHHEIDLTAALEEKWFRYLPAKA